MGSEKTSVVEKKVINKSMTIGEIVQKYPETIEVMASHGLHCIGCSVNYMETIEEGAASHGMPEQEIDSMVDSMNGIVAESGVLESEGKAISLSPAAAEKVRQLMEKEGKNEMGLFVGMQKGGCSGNSYVLAFQENPEPGQVSADERGVKIFMFQEQLPLLQGIRIDYVDGLQGAGFKIVNPNAHKTCGCGQSFR